MKKKLLSPLISDYVTIVKGAAASNDGHRCMIGPSPELKKKLKTDLNQLKRDLGSSVLSNLIKPLGKSRVGYNDALLQPGSVFALGTSAALVRSRSAERAPLQGNLKVAVILVDFSDKPMTETKKRFEDLFFSEGVIATGSVKEYYKEVTNGLVTISGQVVGPYRMPKKLSQYAHGESGTGNTAPNARTLAADAAKAANPAINFTSYDNNNDGYVDAFVVIHAGPGAEVTGSKNDIWSHKWVLPSVYNADGTHIYGYLTVPEDCELGVCAHELGHLLFGFPDLYDVDYTSEGIGDWCLMAGGSWNNNGATPAHPCAWCKMQQNWVTTINQSSNKAKVVIDDVKKGRTIYRLWQDGGPGNEYFLAEHRMKKNFDKYLPGEGLLVYHIDDAIDDNSNEMHYKVAVVQADNKQDLEKGTNGGDGGDVWPGTAKKKTFSKTTKPSSKSYGGLDTKVAIKKIKLANGKITADLYVKTGAATSPKKKAVAAKKK
ncbi:MAG: M6 family metalloprotease domain-containing protein [Agriterribacter sp.]